METIANPAKCFDDIGSGEGVCFGMFQRRNMESTFK